MAGVRRRDSWSRWARSIVVRQTADGKEYRTDQGNLILDCDFGPIADAAELARQLEARAGIVEHGLFLV